MDEFTLAFVFNLCNGETIQKLHRVCRQYRKIIDDTLHARIKTKYGWNEKTCERVCELNDVLCLQYIHKKCLLISENCCNISVIYNSFDCLKYIITLDFVEPIGRSFASCITTDIVKNAIGHPRILRECLKYWNYTSYTDLIIMLDDIISYGDIDTFVCYIDVMKDESCIFDDIYNKIIDINNLELLECLLRRSIPITRQNYFDAIKNGKLECVKLIDKLQPNLFPNEFIMDPNCVEYICEMIRRHARRNLTCMKL